MTVFEDVFLGLQNVAVDVLLVRVVTYGVLDIEIAKHF